MNTGAFIGGVLTGMLGLAAAAMIDHEITEAKFSPDLKNPEKLDSERLIQELNNYFFKAQNIYSRCNETMLEATDLIVTPIELPWDNPMQKLMNAAGGKLASWCRRGRVSELMNLGRELTDLYARYLGVFERANSLAVEQGHGAEPVRVNLFHDAIRQPENSIENEDWDIEFSEVADTIINAIEESCEMAERLIDKLEQGPLNKTQKAIALYSV